MRRARRSAALPRVPPIAETVPGYDVVQWYAVVGPRGLPRDIVVRLHAEIADAAPFWPAERHHQDYFAQNPAQPDCMGVVAPKVAKFRKQFLDRLKRRTTAG